MWINLTKKYLNEHSDIMTEIVNIYVGTGINELPHVSLVFSGKIVFVVEALCAQYHKMYGWNS